MPLGNEFQVTPSSTNANTLSDVAMDANDDFVVVWEGDFQSSSTWGVYGDYFTAASAPSRTLPATWTSTGAMLLNNTPNSRGSFPARYRHRSARQRTAGRHGPNDRRRRPPASW